VGNKHKEQTMKQDDKKHIAILGSTGSIGRQTLEVIENNLDKFSVEVLTANHNADLLIEQAKKFQPNCVVIVDKSLYKKVNDELFDEGIKVFCGSESLEDVVQFKDVDIVLQALVGFAGLRPTIKAIEAKKTIALANKETLVVAGELITKKAIENNVAILPVDSEHSAIFQCLVGEYLNPIKKILLTASGGPFFGWKKEEVEKVTPKQALNHPNWTMGKKVTIDSATLMNKGLEVIEARWLFNVQPNNITAVIHPQSIVHSMVEFMDGSIKAQMATADMRLPIMYALSYPKRIKSDFPCLDIFSLPNINFFQPDREVFHCLDLAYKAIEQGGNIPTIMNAANEIAVEAFLEEKIKFLEIADTIEKSMEKYNFIKNPSFEDYLQTDSLVREDLKKKYQIK
jgi:1-deoxy-D-xylulose-5-phosphate reductoisomerase